MKLNFLYLLVGLWISPLACPQAPPNPVGAATKGFWIVESEDSIKARDPLSKTEHDFSGKRFNFLYPSDEVFCTPKVLNPSLAQGRTKGSASHLSCAITQVDTKKLLTDKIPAGRWIALVSIPELQSSQPSQPVKTTRDLTEEMDRRTRPAGLAKASGCTGNMPISAPACLETVDFDDFSVEWSDLLDGGALGSLFLDTLDEVRVQSIRLDRIPLDRHRFSDARIKQFFEDIQKDAAPTNVLLRFSESQGIEATRVITIPSRIEQKGFREELAKIDSQHAVIRNIAQLSVYVNFGLWSKAANQARELLALAPDEDEVKPYALIGLCQSGYTREKEELRTNLKRLGVTDICPAEAQK